MVRKQVYIERRQERLLKRWARKTGKTEAEIIRQALDLHTPPEIRTEELNRAWEQEKEFIRRLMAKGPVPATPGGRTWRREDLYDRPYPGRH